MALDRDATLKKAEKLLRQGRLEPAIAEYVRVVDEFAARLEYREYAWRALRARRSDRRRRSAQSSRIAQHFVDEGFYPKAAALYKKILKLQPQDEVTQIQLADISARQGLLADAKVSSQRHRRASPGQRRSAWRGGNCRPPRRRSTRRTSTPGLPPPGRSKRWARRKRPASASRRCTTICSKRAGRRKRSTRSRSSSGSIRSSARPRSILAKAALEQGDVAGAREFLDEDSAGDDPVLLLPLAEIELRSGELTRAKGLLVRMIAADPSRRAGVSELGWSLLETSPETTFTCLEAAVDGAMAASAASRKLRPTCRIRRSRARTDSGAAQARRSLR